MINKVAFLFFGAVFGFTLSRVGASDYNLIYGMFTGSDFKLFWVMGSAIVVGYLGMRILNLAGYQTYRGEPLKIKKIPLSGKTVAGGLIFGVGWGLSGACPGTVLAQLGEGKLLAWFTVAGLILGTYLYALLLEKWPALK